MDLVGQVEVPFFFPVNLSSKESALDPKTTLQTSGVGTFVNSESREMAVYPLFFSVDGISMLMRLWNFFLYRGITVVTFDNSIFLLLNSTLAITHD